MTAADLSMVWPEDFGWPQDIGALAILDGASLADANGRLAIEMIRARIERRLHLLPRFRQVLHMPGRGLGWPLWVDAPSFDLANHVDVFPLGPRADEERLLAACEELFAWRMDRSAPCGACGSCPGCQRAGSACS